MIDKKTRDVGRVPIVKIHNQFLVPLSVPKAWEILNDIPRVARCAPGAKLVEARDDGSYVGTVKIKLGPVALSFRGTLVYKERDLAAYRVVAEASGNEERARGAARAQVVFDLSESGSGTRVVVNTDVLLAGSIAQYGRGAALIQGTAQVLMDEFARNFAAEFGGSTIALESAGAEPDQKALPPVARSASIISLLFRGMINALRSWFNTKRAVGRGR